MLPTIRHRIGHHGNPEMVSPCIPDVTVDYVCLITGTIPGSDKEEYEVIYTWFPGPVMAPETVVKRDHNFFNYFRMKDLGESGSKLFLFEEDFLAPGQPMNDPIVRVNAFALLLDVLTVEFSGWSLKVRPDKRPGAPTLNLKVIFVNPPQ